MRGNRQARRLLQATLDAPRRAASPNPRAGGEWLTGVDKMWSDAEMGGYQKIDKSSLCFVKISCLLFSDRVVGSRRLCSKFGQPLTI